MAKISACMVVRNEERMLPQCLDSLKAANLHELIVVDTGSTDRTLEILKETGATIIQEEWQDDFSKHRNTGIERATGDWIFIIDADEVVRDEDWPVMHSILDNEAHQFDLVAPTRRDMLMGGNYTLDTTQIRFFRNGKGYHYEKRVHNQLIVPDGEKIAYQVPFLINHFGYCSAYIGDERMKEKRERISRMCKAATEDTPDDAMVWYNYARSMESLSGGNVSEYKDEFIQTCKRAIGISKDEQRHIKVMCCNMIGWCYYQCQEYDEAHNWASAALNVKPNYIDAILLRAYIYLDSKQLDEAEAWLNRYLIEQRFIESQMVADGVMIVNANKRETVYRAMAAIEAERTKELSHV